MDIYTYHHCVVKVVKRERKSTKKNGDTLCSFNHQRMDTNKEKEFTISTIRKTHQRYDNYGNELEKSSVN